MIQAIHEYAGWIVTVTQPDEDVFTHEFGDDEGAAQKYMSAVLHDLGSGWTARCYWESRYRAQWAAILYSTRSLDKEPQARDVHLRRNLISAMENALEELREAI